ncbi:C45 family autoproteolytic acyltransferase/hydolase [Halobacillus litoralis]|uniref:C45 family autoproteolytic acyltransferase/hydolase n=1 Tax=Halobacillus litoralis TaxID=45668 RepID=UPI001CD7ACFD|nr:C45 family peptidase [Halobacillus litoralis]MCA1023213.1 C45 family autoproteolytic acyltransferase/hydrolase [Halobacillus litoralis]
MKKLFSEVIQFQGRADDFGYEQGKRLKQTPLYESHRQRRPRSIRHYQTDTEHVKAMFLNWAPLLWEELRGLSEGLEWPLDETVHEYSGWQQEWDRSGCSILLGDDYMIRNYDYHPRTYEGRFLLYQPERGTASIGPGQRIIGRTDGMNEHGLCAGYNFVNRLHPEDGFICCTLTRILLESCRDTEEAEKLLKELPHRHSFNYVLFDKAGNSSILEGSPRGVVKKEGLACTNHFSHMPSENRRHLSDSEERLSRMVDRQKEKMDEQSAFSYLNKRSGPIFSDQYQRSSGTIHTAGYSPRTLSLRFGLGGDAQPVPFHLKSWMNGERSPVKTMFGWIDTEMDIPYIDGLS